MHKHRPTKFELMRNNRRILHVAKLREEARELGYDPLEEIEELQAVRERFAQHQASTICGRKPKRRSLLSFMSHAFDWSMGLR